MSDFGVIVPGVAPTLNSSYKVAGVGQSRRIYKDSSVSVWQEAVAWEIKAVRPRGWTPARRVLVTIEWYMPRKRDCDAGVKACLDAVAVGLGVDDSCFLLSVPVNEIDKDRPRTVITVENL